MKSSKEKRVLIAGMIGCLLYVSGNFLFGSGAGAGIGSASGDGEMRRM